ncbi:MAG: S8 family serine peptidase [Thermoplasmata archaeon]|nr:S8 family serine peptidase [Thermoplasmata archaeon]
MAPEATVESHAPLGTGDWATMNANGCVVISNSWGPGGAPAANYDSDSNSADGIMAGNDNILVIFAAGNSGPGPLTISGGGNSWNGLSVAASENFRPEGYASSDDPNQLIEFSSRGPMTSGRIKPDISAIGTAVYSTKPHDGPYDEYSDIYRETLVDIYGPDGTADYIEMSGTSMACPHVAGHIGLVNQYLRDIDGMASPNRALIKGIILNGAIDMGYGYPNYQSGWGRINIKNSLIPDAPRTNLWAEGNLATGQTWDFETQLIADGAGADVLNVESDRVPLKVMLNWDMPSGSAMSNDYDLEVVSPTGVVYKGNCFEQDGDNDDWSHPNPTTTTWDDFGSPTTLPYGFNYDTNNDNTDDINNVEAVFIERPELGIWTVTVDSDSTPNAPNFAVTWGADTGPILNYKVEASTDYPTIFSCAQGGTSMFPFEILNFGTNPDSIQFTHDADADLSVSFSEASPLSLAPNADSDIVMTVTASGAATVGVHKFTITALSLNDPSSPPSQDHIDVTVEVLAEALPLTYQVTTNDMSQYGPSVVAFEDQFGTDHVIIAYASEEQLNNGNRVYMKHTTDDLTVGGSINWDVRACSDNSDGPGDIRISHMTSGTYQDRVFISWSGWDPTDFSDWNGAWSWVSWADPPYTSWNPVEVFTDADNVAGDDTFRMTMTATSGANDQVMFLVESNWYVNENLAGVDTFGKLSTNGGVSWGGEMQVSPGDGNYYFFPNAFTDHNDNIICNYYWRTPLGTDRDLCYNYWDGSAWAPAGAYYSILDTTDNCMFPSGTSTLEGPGGTNRLYNFFTRATTSDSPKDGYVLWADTDGGYPTIATDWNGPYEVHPDIGGTTTSDSNYPDRPILDVDATFNGVDWYIWPQYLESQEDYNPYGVYNIHNTVSDDGFTTMKELNLITADAYVKNHQVGDALGEYMYETYNSYSGNLETGNMDVWLKVYRYDWINEADTYGPDTSMVGCTPDPVGEGWTIDIQANIDDMSSGFSDIAAAEWCRGDTPAGPWFAMTALDGTFDSATESVIASTNTGGWGIGFHTIWVRGQDAALPTGNWGNAVNGTVEVKDITEAPQVEVIDLGLGPIEDSSGTIVIDWTATDLEDNNEDLFITIDYWDGAGWVNIENYDNTLNAASGTSSYNWNTAPLINAADFMVRVIAEDSSTKTGEDVSEYFSMDNPAVRQWHFQVQSTGANMDLNLNPVETEPKETSSLGIPGTGAILIDTWETTDETFTDQAIDGLWTFDVYGYMSAAGTSGRLFAKVFSSSNMVTPIDTTINDDTDVTDTSALYTWTDTLAGGITNGDNIVIEIWLDVTTGGGSGSGSTLNPDFTSGAAPWTFVAWDDPSGTPVGDGTGGYAEITLIDSNAGGPAVEETVSGYWEQSFTTASAPGSANLNFDWSVMSIGVGDSNMNAQVFIDTSAGAPSNMVWDSGTISAISGWTSVGPIDVSGSVNAATTYYLKIAFKDTDLAKNEVSRIMGYDNIILNYDTPAPTFQMEFDFSQTSSKVLPSIVGGVAPSAFDIPTGGAGVGEWIFVSFPVAVTGDVEAIFDDTTFGDGDTTWDIIMWYDPADLTNHWKSFNRDYGGAVTLPASVNNQMGFWVRLDTAGSELTVGMGAEPAGTTISLVAGWNMVGYPSQAETFTAGELTANIEVDMVEHYDSGAAYDITTMPAGDAFLRGEAYWIHCTADYNWVIP